SSRSLKDPRVRRPTRSARSEPEGCSQGRCSRPGPTRLTNRVRASRCGPYVVPTERLQRQLGQSGRGALPAQPHGPRAVAVHPHPGQLPAREFSLHGELRRCGTPGYFPRQPQRLVLPVEAITVYCLDHYCTTRSGSIICSPIPDAETTSTRPLTGSTATASGSCTVGNRWITTGSPPATPSPTTSSRP